METYLIRATIQSNQHAIGMMRRGQSNTTQIGGHNMLKAIVVAGFLDDGALQGFIPESLIN